MSAPDGDRDDAPAGAGDRGAEPRDRAAERSGDEPPSGATSGADPSGTDRPTPGAERLEPLQAAAQQLIAAARGLLDAAEAVVEDPQALGQIAGVVSDLGQEAVRVAARAGRQAARGTATPSGPGPASQRREAGDRGPTARPDGHEDSRGEDGDGGGVQSIPIG